MRLKDTDMKKSLFSLSALALAASTSLGAVTLISGPAYADVAASKAVVDAAKVKGAVGEGNDGYLKFVSGSGDAATTAAVNEINAGRKGVYAEAATKNGVTPEVAGAAAFVNVILPKVKPGEYYQDTKGAWVRK
jgi:uncharacterized protein